MDRQEMEHQISRQFRRANHMLKRCIEYRVKDTGVFQSQHRILMHLSRNPNCSQVELAGKLEVSPAAIAVSIKKLEKGGYIRRQTNAADSRVHQVIITPKGQQVIEKSIVMFQKAEEDMFVGFSDEQMQQLSVYLEKIYRNLDEKRRMEENNE